MVDRLEARWETSSNGVQHDGYEGTGVWWVRCILAKIFSYQSDWGVKDKANSTFGACFLGVDCWSQRAQGDSLVSSKYDNVLLPSNECIYGMLEMLSVHNEIGTYQRWFAALGECESSPFFQYRRERWELPVRRLVNMHRNSNEWRRVIEYQILEGTWLGHAMVQIDAMRSGKPASRDFSPLEFAILFALHNRQVYYRLQVHPVHKPFVLSPHLSPTTPLAHTPLNFFEQKCFLWHLPLSRQSRLQFLCKPRLPISAALQVNPEVSLRLSLNPRYPAPLLLTLTMCERYLWRT